MANTKALKYDVTDIFGSIKGARLEPSLPNQTPFEYKAAIPSMTVLFASIKKSKLEPSLPSQTPFSYKGSVFRRAIRHK